MSDQCICHGYSEDMGGGYYATMLEPNPECPEHFPRNGDTTNNEPKVHYVGIWQEYHEAGGEFPAVNLLGGNE